MFTYADDGRREPVDPSRMGPHMAGCLLCGPRATTVGIFIPTTDAMLAVVLRLRQHPVRARSTACIAYGLCQGHVGGADVTDRVERTLIAAAEKVVVQ